MSDIPTPTCSPLRGKPSRTQPCSWQSGAESRSTTRSTTRLVLLLASIFQSSRDALQRRSRHESSTTKLPAHAVVPCTRLSGGRLGMVPPEKLGRHWTMSCSTMTSSRTTRRCSPLHPCCTLPACVRFLLSSSALAQLCPCTTCHATFVLTACCAVAGTAYRRV